MEIDIDSNTAILLSIELFIQHSRFVMDAPIDKDELIHNIENLFHNKEARKFWLSKLCTIKEE